MTKLSIRLFAVAALLLFVVSFTACKPGQSDPAGPIDIESPLSSGTPGSDPAGSASPGQTQGVTPGVTPGGAEGTDEPEPTPTPVQTPKHTSSIDASTITGTETVEEEEKLSYEEYRKLNDDVVGWIKIKDTNVDYPVVQSHDNEEYLTLTPTLVESKAGSIYVDSHCSLSDQYAVIHGHNMSKSKIMFAQLTNYGNRSFYDNHRTFEMTIGDATYTYKVFAVYTVDVGDVKNAKYMMFEYPSTTAFANYMNETLAPLSQFPVDTEISTDDHVITLSTCHHNGSGYDYNRFVVHAVRQ